MGVENAYREQMREMLFSLKSIVKDTDNEVIKQKIDSEIVDIEVYESRDISEKVSFVKKTVENVEESFQKRKKQMITDCQIVKKIDDSLDIFRKSENEKVQNLVGTLVDEVNKEIEKYCKEIVSALNPYEIKERFETKEKFEQWLTLRNENYKNVLNKSIERKVQGVVRKYLDDVDILFETLGKYLDERENYLEIEDKFYGSLAVSKKSTLEQTRNTVGELTVYNKTLYESSEELFNKIYNERNKLDNIKKGASIGGGITGLTTGIGTYAVIAAQATAEAEAITAGASAATVAAAAAGDALVVATGAVFGVALGAIAIYGLSKGANHLASKIYGSNMEKKVELYIGEFNQEVEKTKGEMQVLLTQNTIGMFENEQQRIEKSFLELRKVTYIDEKNIPVIEERVEKLKKEVKNYA